MAVELQQAAMLVGRRAAQVLVPVLQAVHPLAQLGPVEMVVQVRVRPLVLELVLETPAQQVVQVRPALVMQARVAKATGRPTGARRYPRAMQKS